MRNLEACDFISIIDVADYQVCGWGLCETYEGVRLFWSGIGGVVFRCEEHKADWTPVVEAK